MAQVSHNSQPAVCQNLSCDLLNQHILKMRCTTSQGLVAGRAILTLKFKISLFDNDSKKSKPDIW